MCECIVTLLGTPMAQDGACHLKTWMDQVLVPGAGPRDRQTGVSHMLRVLRSIFAVPGLLDRDLRCCSCDLVEPLAQFESLPCSDCCHCCHHPPHLLELHSQPLVFLEFLFFLILLLLGSSTLSVLCLSTTTMVG